MGGFVLSNPTSSLDVTVGMDPNGITLTARVIRVIQLLAGDTDGDGDVDQEDLNTLLSHFGQSGLVGGKQVGDFDMDGKVGDPDLNVLLSDFGISTNPSIGATAIEAGGGAVVPEPASAIVLGITMVLCISRLRRIRPFRSVGPGVSAVERF